MGAVFVEYNSEYKGKIPEDLKPIIDDLKNAGTVRLNKKTANRCIKLGVGNWVSRVVGKRREALREQQRFRNRN